jgi:hypothetical protein
VIVHFVDIDVIDDHQLSWILIVLAWYKVKAYNVLCGII